VGLQAGIEGTIHGMNELFSIHQDQGTGWDMLLVDTANAFNSLNRAAMLLDAHVLWLVLCGQTTFFFFPHPNIKEKAV